MLVNRVISFVDQCRPINFPKSFLLGRWPFRCANEAQKGSFYPTWGTVLHPPVRCNQLKSQLGHQLCSQTFPAFVLWFAFNMLFYLCIILNANCRTTTTATTTTTTTNGGGLGLRLITSYHDNITAGIPLCKTDMSSSLMSNGDNQLLSC